MENIMDRTAAMSSEIFREYVKNELKREALEKQQKKAEAPNINDVLGDLDEFERRVKSDPKLRVAFKALQEKFATDTSYREKVNPIFVDGVMLLDLDEDQE